MADTVWADHKPLDWYRLIAEAEAIRREHGLGLAGVWGRINAGDYAGARDALDEVKSWAGSWDRTKVR